MDSLPDDCLIDCFKHLDIHLLIKCRLINKKLNRLYSTILLAKYQSDYDAILNISDIKKIELYYKMKKIMDTHNFINDGPQRITNNEMFNLLQNMKK